MLNEKGNSLIDSSKRARVRVCGVLIEEDKILLLKHISLGEMGYLWLPPGGGVEYGENLEDALVREFKEETGLEVIIEQFLFTNEMINSKHHAIELFFQVKRISGKLVLGSDPEFSPKNQILSEAHFFSKKELHQIPTKAIHNAFSAAKTRDKIAELRGLITFKH